MILDEFDEAPQGLLLPPVGSDEAEEALEIAAIHMRSGMKPVEALLLTAEAMYGHEACAKAKLRLAQCRGRGEIK